jgi:hypothetical protein
MSILVRCLLVFLLCVGLQSCQRPEHREHPQLVSYRFERPEEGHIIAVGSWKPFPSPGWVPYASVRIDCRREQAECTEFRARMIADEHGEHPDRILPELTYYRIETWSPDEIRATTGESEHRREDLIIHPKTGYVRHYYPDKRARFDASDYWLLQ